MGLNTIFPKKRNYYDGKRIVLWTRNRTTTTRLLVRLRRRVVLVLVFLFLSMRPKKDTIGCSYIACIILLFVLVVLR